MPLPTFAEDSESKGKIISSKKVETILDLLGVEFALRPKGRPKTLEELQDGR